jgi:hypothetical protein
MNTVALLSAEDRLALFTETGAAQGLHPFHVEKDFWVCWVLATLFGHGEIGPNLTFRRQCKRGRGVTWIHNPQTQRVKRGIQT